MTIFGVPASDERLMLELTQGLFGAGDPEYLGDATDPVELVGRTIQKFSDYFDELTAKRRAHPTDDLATVIANGQVDGSPSAMPSGSGTTSSWRPPATTHLLRALRRHGGAARPSRAARRAGG